MCDNVSSDTMMDSVVLDPTGAARGDLEAGGNVPGRTITEPTSLNATPAAHHPTEPQVKRNPGLVPILSTAAVSASLVAIVRPTPKALYSHKLLTVAYTWDVITLLALGILAFALAFALAAVPDKWLGALRATMIAVASTVLLLLILLASFVGYGLIFLDIHH